MEQLRVEHTPREPPLCTQPPAVGWGWEPLWEAQLGGRCTEGFE